MRISWIATTWKFWTILASVHITCGFWAFVSPNTWMLNEAMRIVGPLYNGEDGGGVAGAGVA